MAEPEKLVANSSQVQVAPITDHLLFRGASPEMLAIVGAQAIKEIARSKSPSVLYPKISEYTDDDPEGISSILFSEEILAEAALWVEVVRFAALLESGVVDFLKQRGLSFQDNECDASFLLRAQKDRPDLCTEALLQLREAQGPSFDGKSSAVFESLIPSPTVEKAIENLDKNALLNRMQQLLQKQGYGSVCDVEAFKRNNRIGFIFYRAGRQSNEMKIDSQNNRKFRKDRPIRTDIVTFVPDTNTLWVYARSGGDVEMYLQCLGEMLGSPNNFKRRQNFELGIFLNKNVGDFLKQIAVELELARIDLKKMEVRIGKSGKYTDGATRSERCLTDRYSDISAIHAGNKMKFVRLRLHSSIKDKIYVDVDLHAEKIAVGAGLDEEILSALLAKLGVWKAQSNA